MQFCGVHEIKSKVYHRENMGAYKQNTWVLASNSLLDSRENHIDETCIHIFLLASKASEYYLM